MTEASNKSMTPEKPFWSGKGVLSSSTSTLWRENYLSDNNDPFFINNETDNL
jgi:hypothetical protein